MAGEMDQYKLSGVNYDMMDPWKIACQQAAAPTGRNIERFQKQGITLREDPRSRGESSYRFRITTHRPMTFDFSQVGEGIGTKNLIADYMREISEKLRIADEARLVLGKSFYRGIGIDNAATIFNDLSASGASPIGFNLFIATGSSEWFTDDQRSQDLIDGTTDAVNVVRSSWGGGESQTLVDLVGPDRAVLAGSGVGISFSELNQYPSEENLKPGLAIVLVEGKKGEKIGPQTNGLTLLRKGMIDDLAKDMGLPEERKLDAYTFDLGNGQTYGEAVLTPSAIYSPLMDRLLLDPFDDKDPIPVAYAAHISGHGYAKLMRAKKELTYVLDKLPDPHPLFNVVQEFRGMSNKAMYYTYSMGAAYAVFVEPQYVGRVIETADQVGQHAFEAGFTQEGPKKVVLIPNNVVFKPEDLNLR